VLIIGLAAARLAWPSASQPTRLDLGAYAIYYDGHVTTTQADLLQSDAEARALSSIQAESRDTTVYHVTAARLLHGVSRIESITKSGSGFDWGGPVDVWVIEVEGTTAQGWNADGMVAMRSSSGEVLSQHLLKEAPATPAPATSMQ
jgi:hypothetical protein